MKRNGGTLLSLFEPQTNQGEESYTPTDIRAPISDNSALRPRRDRCWACKAPVATAEDRTCSKCGWIICPQCAECKEGCSGDLEDAEDEVDDRPRACEGCIDLYKRGLPLVHTTCGEALP